MQAEARWMVWLWSQILTQASKVCSGLWEVFQTARPGLGALQKEPLHLYWSQKKLQRHEE